MRTFSTLSKVLSALLIFMLGFLLFPAALLGVGYWAYNNLSYDYLEKNGVISFEEDKFLSDDAEYSLPSATLKELIEEGKYIASIKDTISLDILSDRYGLIIPEVLDEILDDEMRAKPIAQLFSKDTLDAYLDTLYIGNLLQYASEPNPAYNAETAPDEPEYLWYINGEPIAAIDATLANIKLSDIISGEFSADNLINDLKLADIFNITAKENLPVYIPTADGVALAENVSITVWLDDAGTPADAIIGAIAGYGINDIETKLDELSIADVIGYVCYNDEWYTWSYENGEAGERILLSPESGITAELADLTINGIGDGALDDKLNGIELSIILGYTKDAHGDWYDDEGNKIDGVMAAIADSTVGDLGSTVDGIKIGEIADFTYVPSDDPDGEGVWYEIYVGENSPENVVAGGILGAFAALTVDDMTDNTKLTEKVKTLTVSDALGYTLGEDGCWYDGETKLTGVMAVLAGTKLDGIQDKIDGTQMGDLLDYRFDEEERVWKAYDEATGDYTADVHVLMNKIAGTKFEDIDTITEDLKLCDIIPEEDRNSGFIKLMSPETKLNDMASEVNSIFDDTKLHVFVDEGIIAFEGTPEEQETKKARFAEGTELGDLTISGLFDYIVETEDRVADMLVIIAALRTQIESLGATPVR